jgi:hypothetical protein
LLAKLPIFRIHQPLYHFSYKVYEVTPANQYEYHLLKEWEHVIDHWDGLKRKGSSRVMVAPAQQTAYESFLTGTKIAHRVIIDDVEVYVFLQTLITTYCV